MAASQNHQKRSQNQSFSLDRRQCSRVVDDRSFIFSISNLFFFFLSISWN
uniref:Uncharacterized protein n=1 Tax=Anguilla anguilla TaxID=7936 RepID=A0A0E9W1X2_ANGAN